VERLIIKIQLI